MEVYYKLRCNAIFNVTVTDMTAKTWYIFVSLSLTNNICSCFILIYAFGIVPDFCQSTAQKSETNNFVSYSGFCHRQERINKSVCLLLCDKTTVCAATQHSVQSSLPQINSEKFAVQINKSENMFVNFLIML